MQSRLGPFTALAALAVSGAMLTGQALASSHREAPGVTNLPAVDNTDTYFFVSPENPDAVTLVGCWWPLEEASGGPNWYHFGDDVAYEFHIDNDGDAVEEITYIFRFRTRIGNPNTFLYATGAIGSLDDADWNYRQLYSVTRIDGGGGRGRETVLATDLLVPPVNIGPRTTPSYEVLAAAAVYALPGGERVFAGQRDDPLYVDLGGVFDLLGFRAVPGNMGQGVDGLGGYNCQAIVLEVPIARLTRDGSNPSDPAGAAAVLGLWATSERARRPDYPDAGVAEDGEAAKARQTPPGLFEQVSRLGMPLVNEVVIPLGKKDRFNRSAPKDDAQFLDHVTHPELPAILSAL